MKENLWEERRQPAGQPYTGAELANCHLREKYAQALACCQRGGGRPAVWLTQRAQRVRQLAEEGECVIWLLTPQNRDGFCKEADWCWEIGEGQDGIGDDFLWKVWLRRHNLPWHICETRRLSIRELMEEDLDFLYTLSQDTQNAFVGEKMSLDRRTEQEKLAAYCKRIYGFYGFGIWLVVGKEDGLPVGLAGLQMREGYEEPELGFIVAAQYRGRGYAGEACQAVLAYARTELEVDAVRAVADAENKKSRLLCEHLGFTQRTTVKCNDRPCVIYTLSLGKNP